MLSTVYFSHASRRDPHRHGKTLRSTGPASGSRRQTGSLQGWVRTRRDSKGGFQLHRIERWLLPGNIQIVALTDLANYETEIEAADRREREHRRRSQGRRRPRARPRRCTPKRRHSWRGRSGEISAAEEGPHLRVSPHHHRPLAAQNQHLWQHRPHSQPGQQIDSFLPGTRLPLYSRPHHHGQRCEGARRLFKVTTLNLANVP